MHRCVIIFHVFHLLDDSFFCLLHLWTHWRHPEHSVSKSSVQEVLLAPCFLVSRMYRHQRMHHLHLAYLSLGQLWAKEDVSRKRTLTSPLSWNDRKGNEILVSWKADLNIALNNAVCCIKYGVSAECSLFVFTLQQKMTAGIRMVVAINSFWFPLFLQPGYVMIISVTVRYPNK